MKIIRKAFKDWDDATKRRLRYATAYGGYLKIFMKTFPNSPTIVLFSNVQIMGWAFALQHTHNNSVNIGIFINERYRKRGLAELLVEESLQDFEIISLNKWNKKTKRLFERFRRKHPNRIIVIDWWKNVHKYDEIIKKKLLSN